jgi:hypothetical protein
MGVELPRVSATSRTHHVAHRIRGRVIDYVLYIAITFAFFAMVFVVQSKWGHDAFIRWGGLAGFTLILFGYFVGDSRSFLHKRQFWLLTALLLAMHLALFMVILSHVDEWRLMWFTGMALEYPVFLFFRGQLPEPS